MGVESVGVFMLFFKLFVVVVGFIFALIGMIMKRIDKILNQLNIIQAEHNLAYPKCLNFEVNNDSNIDGI